MNTSNNVYTMQITLNKVLEDLYKRIEDTLQKYIDSPIPDLPNLDSVMRREVYYKYYASCVKIEDEIVALNARLDLVCHNFKDINKFKVTRDMSNNFDEIVKFKEFLTHHIEKMNSLRYNLIEVKKLANDRLKLLQTMAYSSFNNE